MLGMIIHELSGMTLQNHSPLNGLPEIIHISFTVRQQFYIAVRFPVPASRFPAFAATVLPTSRRPSSARFRRVSSVGRRTPLMADDGTMAGNLSPSTNISPSHGSKTRFRCTLLSCKIRFILNRWSFLQILVVLATLTCKR
ncbi:hypothetical protein KSP39_PZI014965 [Platanthera zijinensis]|uniref:Uncharacterized protein n=1 Tax=Platanthera zijinensis TaxID=2320716 RepID=A0AAP0BBC2_9ASPA